MADFYVYYQNVDFLVQNGIVEKNTVSTETTVGGGPLKIKKGNKQDRRAPISDILDALKKRSGEYYGTLRFHSDGESDEVTFIDMDHSELVIEGEAKTHLLSKIGKSEAILASTYLYGQEHRSEKDSRVYITPVFICRKITPRETNATDLIPVCNEGLNHLLFPQKNDVGFRKPGHSAVVPRIILIKGTPGSGKTTLAIQLMVGMAKKKINCSYWCISETYNSVRKMAVSFEFIDIEGFNTLSMEKNRIAVADVGLKYLDYLRQKKGNKDLEDRDVLFVDSLNVSQIEGANRKILWELFKRYKEQNLLTFFLLEDYGKEGSEKSRELIADCEFLSDVVIELSEGSEPEYQTRHIEIKKKHYGIQVLGKHLYKICPPNHSFSNIIDKTGFVIFPSIHWYFSKAIEETELSRERGEEVAHTGITHLDSILAPENKFRILDGKTMPRDAGIVIRGKKGGHKLALGLNVLMGGLWRIESSGAERGKEAAVVGNGDVLILQLDEEPNIFMNRVAIARRTHLMTRMQCNPSSLDNGTWLEWIDDEHCSGYDDLMKHSAAGKKLLMNKWCCSIKGSDHCMRVVVAAFRPGFLPPEEFIAYVVRLLEETKPSRVLFASTAHMQTGFPLLSREKLLFRLLIDIFKSRNIMSIFVDVEDEGSSKERSFGLASLADYLLTISPFELALSDRIKLRNPSSAEFDEEWRTRIEENRSGMVWSQLDAVNVRGKKYSRLPHAIAVDKNDSGENELLILNAEIESKYCKKVQFISTEQEKHIVDA